MKLCNDHRRQFLLEVATGMGAVLSTGALAWVLAGCESDTTKPSSSGHSVEFDVSSEPLLATLGGIVKRKFGSHNGGMPVFIVRIKDTGSDAFVVLSSRCTHKSCEVDLTTQGSGVLRCPCHAAEFDARTGTQTQPPSGRGPTGPLQRFAATFDSQRNILTITF